MTRTHPTRRPAFWLYLTDGLTLHPQLSLPAKLLGGVAAGLPGRDPAADKLEVAFPHRRATFYEAAAELERLGLADLTRMRGKRTIIRPQGIARPGNDGLRRYAIIPPAIVYPALDAVRVKWPGEAIIVVQRLLREQAVRGAAHIPCAVLADALRLPIARVRRLLADLEAAGVIERHPTEPGYEADAPILTVPKSPQPPELAKLRADGTRGIVTLGLDGARLALYATARERDAIETRLLQADNDDEDAQRVRQLVAALAREGGTHHARAVFARLDAAGLPRRPLAPVDPSHESDDQIPP